MKSHTQPMKTTSWSGSEDYLVALYHTDLLKEQRNKVIRNHRASLRHSSDYPPIGSFGWHGGYGM